MRGRPYFEHIHITTMRACAFLLNNYDVKGPERMFLKALDERARADLNRFKLKAAERALLEELKEKYQEDDY
ncbi:hypothetical protein [Agrobacterium tumefaciens]|uniref:Uncharacterized protein n=1 Tax=Agrobacterium tumefaciens TaxID=358 RepID=A0AA44F6C7_AGRTU|nr:hypothetical protein [Agrobacterium tumefaciens]NTB86397.1 hypothetical protein [Agrobacterium tumefaciens]NTC17413.1 hypothetical protein [Agrobacterium tumefaciens]NTC30274.1 hypothetical protein [Agrobacterium tumefaciens]